MSFGTASSSSRIKPRIVAVQLVQHGLVGLCHRASQPVYFKRPHLVSGPPATTLQFTGLVKIANADPRGNFLLFEAKRSSRDTEEGFCVSVLALMVSEGFMMVNRVTSPFRTATLEGNRFTHSVDRSPEGRRISWARKGVQPVSG